MLVIKYLGGKVDHLESKGIIHLSMVRSMAQRAKQAWEGQNLGQPFELEHLSVTERSRKRKKNQTCAICATGQCSTAGTSQV